MHYNNYTEKHETDHGRLFIQTKKITKKMAKIEELKARQQLLKELQDIDNRFNFSLKDLI